MKIEILSTGSVAPLGSGMLGVPEKCPEISFAGSNELHPVALVNEKDPELIKWSKEPRLRRASPISIFLIEAAHQALQAFPDIDRSRLGVVSAFFLGCLDYSIKFYKQVNIEGRRFGSPVLFPETVFNTPVSHVVSTLGIGGPVYSQIGDKSCWVSALRTAECWLRNDSADHVLVLGAEEFDPHLLDALQASRLLKKGFPIANGAGAILLSTKCTGPGVTLASINSGCCFYNRSQANKVATDCISEIPASTPILSNCIRMNGRNLAPSDTQRQWLSDEKMKAEAFTASAAWDTIRGVQLIQELNLSNLAVAHWGVTHEHGTILLSR